tara:strand:- start:1072 stop:3657 length:2586 start_codon:yes stop_codon:yes gene_type:complete
MTKTYTREEVYSATLIYFGGDELAANVWADKYCLRNEQTYYELTPDQMHRRIAKEFARIENNYPNSLSEDIIYGLLKDFKYIIPQGSPMKGIGNDFALTSISNCFVIGGQPDSYGGIFNADEEQAQLMKRRGGVGQDLSYLRPSGSLANKEPLGPNAGMPLYMERFSNTTREVQQDGRRGALMLSVSVKHPDAERFIDKKMTEGAVTGANVSVKITDEFVSACNNGDDFFQVFPIDMELKDVIKIENICDEVGYDTLYKGKLIDGVQTYWKKIKPQALQDKLVYNAWKSAEPGSLFWDKIRNESPAKGYGKAWEEISTNPCGEIPLPPYDSCRLMVLNLLSYVENPFAKGAEFNAGKFQRHVEIAQRLMDDFVDIEIEKVKKIISHVESKENLPLKYREVELNLWRKVLDMAVQGRRTGLGITAEGDMLAALGLKYGTKEATEFSERIHQFMATNSYLTSILLADERGAFPMWDLESDSESEFINRIFYENSMMDPEAIERYKNTGRRNIANLTIAPTGSVSIMAQTTSGIEPLFSPYYFRKKKITNETHFDYVDEVGDKWVEFPVFHKQFIEWYAVHMGYIFDGAAEQLSLMQKESLDQLFEASPYYKATAQDVDFIEKARMQGEVQKWVDHSISVTVNMPEDVTVETVSEVYKVAHESGCKGITVYRDNSRGNVLSTTSVKDQKSEFEYSSAVERPKRIDCDIFFKTKMGEDFIILVGKVDDKPYEIFVVPTYNLRIPLSKSHKTGTLFKSKKGRYDLLGENDMPLIDDITSYMIESEQNSTRDFSAMLRHRMDPKFIVEMIEKYASISSFHKVVGKVLKTYIEQPQETGDCPKDDCNGKMRMTDGCMMCPECGYAACG